jgi:hypothetical protein
MINNETLERLEQIGYKPIKADRLCGALRIMYAYQETRLIVTILGSRIINGDSSLIEKTKEIVGKGNLLVN